MPLDFSLADKTYPPVVSTVTADQIAAYADASGDPNPQHRPGPDQIASVVFPVVPGFTAMLGPSSDPAVGVDNPGMIVHGEQWITTERPIRPGDELTMTPRLVRVEDKGRHGIFLTRVDMADATGLPVGSIGATILVRGGGSGGERAPATRPDAEPGPEVARFTSHVDTGMPARYAEASGDHNPIHLDNDFALAMGLPGVINHGLGTLSLVTAGLVTLVAGGDAARIAGLTCRFTGMVIPGDDLETTVTRTPDPATVAFATTRPGGSTVVEGTISTRTA